WIESDIIGGHYMIDHIYKRNVYYRRKNENVDKKIDIIDKRDTIACLCLYDIGQVNFHIYSMTNEKD
ncbi:hypothetical protein J0J30_23945, partial [Vibrio vulnificus]|nr:hypothetical protein [Vibrio vulnificus]